LHTCLLMNACCHLHAHEVQVNDDDPVASIKQTAENLTGIKEAQQQMFVNGAPLKPAGTIKDAGLSDGDVIMLDIQQPRRAAPRGNNLFRQNPDGSLQDPEQLIEALRNNPAALASLRSTMPEQAKAIEQGDVQQLQRIMRMAKLASELPAGEAAPLPSCVSLRCYIRAPLTAMGMLGFRVQLCVPTSCLLGPGKRLCTQHSTAGARP
jgi:hypothetical protein